MAPGGALAAILGPVVGVGANHGVGVLMSLLGMLTGVASLAAFLFPTLRNLERDVPDHAAAASPAVSGE